VRLRHPYNSIYLGGCGDKVKEDSLNQPRLRKKLRCVLLRDCVATMFVDVEQNMYFGIVGGFQITFSITTLIPCTTDYTVLESLPLEYSQAIFSRHSDFPQLQADQIEAFFHTGYLDAWTLMNCAELRADLFECLAWQYQRGPCAEHHTGSCLEWQLCDLEDRILHDCFVFFKDRQTTCKGRWESNLKGGASTNAGPWASTYEGNLNPQGGGGQSDAGGGLGGKPLSVGGLGGGFDEDYYYEENGLIPLNERGSDLDGHSR